MIKQGSNGSVNIFYKDLFIASYPLTKNITYDYYCKLGQQLILDTMRNCPELNIKNQIYTYLYFINLMYRRKTDGKSIWKSNYELLCATTFALIKLDILNIDDNILIMPRKRPKRCFENNNYL